MKIMKREVAIMALQRLLKRNNTKPKRSIKRVLTTPIFKSVLVIIASVIVLSLLFFVGITPQRYNLKVGDIARNTITASKDVVDEISTQVKRDEAAAQVEPSYIFKEELTTQVMTDLAATLTEVRSVQQYGRTQLETFAPGDEQAQANFVFSDTNLEYAKSKLTTVSLANYQLKTLLRVSDQEFDEMCDNLTAAVQNTMNTTVRAGYVSDSIQQIQQIMGYKTSVDLLQNVVTPILRKVIQPNMIIDEEATGKLREDARKAVDPVIYKQGQNIVVARERITANQLEMLRSLGLLDDNNIDYAMYLGGFMTVLLVVTSLLLSLLMFSKKTFREPKKLLIIMLTLMLTLALCIVAHWVDNYMMPAVLCAMLITCLVGPFEAVSALASAAILTAGVLLGGDRVSSAASINIMITSILSGLVCIILLRKKPYRTQILIAGIVAAVCNMLIIMTIGLMTATTLSDVFHNALLSAAGAIVAAVFCIALEPLADAAFNLATPAKLMELSNPNHPVLRRLMIEAAGTYHHSMIVANLAEAAAEEIGANPLLARAGAYFHDIGKLKRPMYFKENQMGENPHDHTNPYVSAAIVTAHTRDGVELAQQAHLPREIQNIIAQHHGDTPVMYFYTQAIKEAGDEPVDIADFRYDGQKPQSREGAIIMLADTVEAAVRSMKDPTPKKIREFINKLVRGKLEDGQLDEAPISLKDIQLICNAFATVLNGVFHERIEYPAISPAAAAHLAVQAATSKPSAVEEKELKKAEATSAEERPAEEVPVEEKEPAKEGSAEEIEPEKEASTDAPSQEEPAHEN